MTSLPGNGIELQMLFCAMALGLIQMLLSLLLGIFSRGFSYEVGPRDEPKGFGKIAGRTDRAFKNFLETFPVFAAAVLLDAMLGKHSAMSGLGAQLYIWARLIYVPVYVAGIPLLRSLVFTGSVVGIVLVMSAFWPGM